MPDAKNFPWMMIEMSLKRAWRKKRYLDPGIVSCNFIEITTRKRTTTLLTDSKWVEELPSAKLPGQVLATDQATQGLAPTNMFPNLFIDSWIIIYIMQHSNSSTAAIFQEILSFNTNPPGYKDVLSSITKDIEERTYWYYTAD